MEIYVQNAGNAQNWVVICLKKHISGSRRTACSCSSPKPLQIQETENKKVTSDIIFRELIRDYNTLEGQAIKIKEAADKEGEYGTSSMMDEYIQSYTKKLWMINQMMG